MILGKYSLRIAALPGEEMLAWATSNGPRSLPALIPERDPKALVRHRFFSEDVKTVVRIKCVFNLHSKSEDMTLATVSIAA
jgi:hypothetical protein